MGAPTRARYLRRRDRATTILISIVVAIALSITAGFSLGQWFRTSVWASPAAVILTLTKKEATWTPLYLIGMGVAALLVLLLVFAGMFVWRKMGGRSAWVDSAAPHMASVSEVKSLTQKSAQATAKRLGGGTEGFVGLPLGALLPAGKMLYTSLEDVGLLFAGPRTGKSSCFGIPHILDATGPVLVTENKRGLHDHTRGVREGVGKVFVFDPQAIVGESADWWFNPLAPVTDESKAYDLAELFAKAEMEAVSSSANGGFFEERATTLLRGLFLAAAISQGQALPHKTGEAGPKYWLRDVQEWIAAPEAEAPMAVELLDGTMYKEVLNELIGIYNAAPQERSGVFSTAQVMTKSLSNRQIASWVNPAAGEENGAGRRLFDPVKFLEGSNTLYSLSKDGSGSAKALVTALTVAVCDAGEFKASTLPGGRLKTPLVVVLDEAANVCRWPKLPKLYSHYGSRGILIDTFLQSYPQGEGVWGKAGMDALLEAANWVAYAGGNKPGHLLSLFSDAIGDYYYSTLGSPGSQGMPRGPRQEQKDKVFDPAELSALPKGRAVLLSSGNRAALLRTVPWMVTKHQEGIRASLKKYDPQAENTIKEATESIEAMRRDPDAVAGVAA
ncbi:type IV secretory system conjugative DNA transfer family protein [Arthrobacter antibioticus]|uniref:type IV secretory system conjugative DNA transfer family protein n=1 Tax=Arthrobacter sp. H35-MC1 TaxID=3046203 RepID=UPI0024B8C553|nr:TraM recognition domain-containing protein [Arthrobacter sp. H35-MC1]MDJ0318605.1 TraM recognition domain-containing protein [Arthrobacter sp. H35-MC1]